MSQERDYVLGTHDEEIARLGLQHRVWRPRALDAWRRAGFTVGQHLLDVGCGPGYASLDLAEIVGPAGIIHSIDRSRRFLDALEKARNARGLENLVIIERDLDADGPLLDGDTKADGAWVRWVHSFVKHPRELLGKIDRTLKPGGTMVLHEYMDYGTWRLIPRSEPFETFVRTVMASWRKDGGEPDIGLQLPGWLEDLGYGIRSLQPIMDIVTPSNFVWEWPKAFFHVGLRRLLDLGFMSELEGQILEAAFQSVEKQPHARMITPALLEIIAVKAA